MSDEITQAIESSIADLPDSDASGGGESVDTSPAETTAAPAEEPAAAQVISEQMVPQTPPRRRGPIPVDRHEAALAAARSEAEATLQRQRAEWDQQTEALRQRAQLLDIADREPERFFRALVQADPRYAQAVQAYAKEQAAQHGNGNGHAGDGDMPAPDAQYPDGSTGYSPQGLKQLLEWQAAQVEQRVSERISQRYKSIEDDYMADQQVRQAVGKVEKQVQDAMTWPGFAEHKDAIGAALKHNRSWSLEAAYRAVVIPMLSRTRDQLRADLIAEANAKPRRVSGTAPGAGAPATGGDESLEAIIKASIAHLPR